MDVDLFPTFSADAAQVCNLHQRFGEHVGFAGPAFPHIDFESLQQWLLELVHLGRLLQVLTIWQKHTQIHSDLGPIKRQIHVLAISDVDKLEANTCYHGISMAWLWKKNISDCVSSFVVEERWLQFDNLSRKPHLNPFFDCSALISVKPQIGGKLQLKTSKWLSGRCTIQSYTVILRSHFCTVAVDRWGWLSGQLKQRLG